MEAPSAGAALAPLSLRWGLNQELGTQALAPVPLISLPGRGKFLHISHPVQ